MKENLTMRIRAILEKKPDLTDEQVYVELLKKSSPESVNLPIKQLDKVAKKNGLAIKSVARAIRSLKERG